MLILRPITSLTPIRAFLAAFGPRPALLSQPLNTVLLPVSLLQSKQPVPYRGSGDFAGVFRRHFLALTQTLPSAASGEEEVRTVIARGMDKEGAMEFDVLYGSACYEDLS